MKTPKAPKAPDPFRQAAAQSGANRDAALSGALLNNYDENSPFGSLRYKQTGFNHYTDAQGRRIAVPKFERNVTLSPEQQDLYNRQMQSGRNLGDLAVSQSAKLNTLLNKPFDPKNLPEQAKAEGINTGQGLPKDYSQDRRRVEDAMMSRYNRMHDRQTSATEARLMNQGLTPGSNAWKTQMEQLENQTNDARMQAILAGGTEQSRLNQLALQRAGFQNQAQQQRYGQQSASRNAALQQEFSLRNQPINEITALMSGAQVRAPQFAGAHRQGIGAANIGGYMQNAYNNRMQKYKARMAQNQAMMSGLFSLGSTAAGGAFGQGGMFSK